MIIQRTSNEIIFRFPKNLKLDDLQDLTDLFEEGELGANSVIKDYLITAADADYDFDMLNHQSNSESYSGGLLF